MSAENAYLVACIVPIHNAERYLCDAIESVIRQTIGFHKIQLILVDDGSIDGSAQICRRYAGLYENVQYIYQEKNGVSSARNIGLGEASGRYIAFLDADDMLEANYMEAGLLFLKQHPVDFIAFPIHYIRDDKIQNLPLPPRFIQAGLVDAHTEYEKIQFAAWGTLIEREALFGDTAGGRKLELLFNESMRYLEDAEFMQRLVHKSMQYGVVNTAFYLYRQHGESVMHQRYRDPEWYHLDFVDLFCRNSMQSFYKVTKYTQYLILYILAGYFTRSIPSGSRGILNEVFFKTRMKKILEQIDHEIILKLIVSDLYKLFFLQQKYDSYGKVLTEKSVVYRFESCSFSISYSICITKIAVIPNSGTGTKVTICGYLHLPDYQDFNLYLVVKGKGRRLLPNKEGKYDWYYLGERVYQAFEFQETFFVQNSCEVMFYMGYHMRLCLSCIQYHIDGIYPDSGIYKKVNSIHIMDQSDG